MCGDFAKVLYVLSPALGVDNAFANRVRTSFDLRDRVLIVTLACPPYARKEDNFYERSCELGGGRFHRDHPHSVVLAGKRGDSRQRPSCGWRHFIAHET